MKGYSLQKLFKFLGKIISESLLGVHPNNTIFNYNWSFIYHLRKFLVKNKQFVKGIVIDIGAGRAPYFTYFKDDVEKYYAVDNSYIEKNKKPPLQGHIGGGGIKLQENKEKEINEKLIFLNADASNIPLSDNTADTIITTQFLYAVPNPEAIIEEISRLIKNDGYLIITVPHSTPLMTDPYDYLRFTPNYFQNYIAQKYCYDVIKIDKSGDIFNSFALSLSMELVLSKYDGRHPMKLIPWRRIVFSPLIFFINALAFFLEHIFIFTRHPGNLAIIMRKK